MLSYYCILTCKDTANSCKIKLQKQKLQSVSKKQWLIPRNGMSIIWWWHRRNATIRHQIASRHWIWRYVLMTMSGRMRWKTNLSIRVWRADCSRGTPISLKVLLTWITIIHILQTVKQFGKLVSILIQILIYNISFEIVTWGYP